MFAWHLPGHLSGQLRRSRRRPALQTQGHTQLEDDMWLFQDAPVGRKQQAALLWLPLYEAAATS
jgi:hypothetical protein